MASARTAGRERKERIARTLQDAGLDGLLCTLPTNVLLLSSYWPVVGTSVALAARDGTIAVLAPEDEEELARHGWADYLHTFRPASLQELTRAAQVLPGPLRTVAAQLGLERGRLGFESGPWFEPATYASLHLYGAEVTALLRQALPSVTPVGADAELTALRTVKTSHEIACIRTACRLAERAFTLASRELAPGLPETEAATLFRRRLSTAGEGSEGPHRADGFAFCMAGPDAAHAYGAYARSRARRLTPGDLVLVHCNSYADGYWTDITRTYCLGEPDDRQRALYEAVFAARAAALAAIRPGVRAADVDRAARDVLTERGYGDQFKHSTGHGVGFAAIDHNARPRLHPASDDVLEAGMVFNVEPAVYLDGFGGLRHCDMVAVTATGAELLTPFQMAAEALVRPTGGG